MHLECTIKKLKVKAFKNKEQGIDSKPRQNNFCTVKKQFGMVH